MPAVMIGNPLILPACNVGMVMSENPVSVPATETAQDVANALIEHRISAAPVIDEAGRPVGVISRTDLVTHLNPPQCRVPTLEEDWFECGNILDDEAVYSKNCLASHWGKTTAEEIMNRRLVTIAPDDSVEMALELMKQHHVHRLFVVDHDGVLVGVLSTFDILNRLERASR